MTLVGMKKLHAIIPAPAQQSVLQAFTSLGCVEVKAADAAKALHEQGLLHSLKASQQAAAHKNELQAALDTLRKYARVKKPLLSAKPEYTEQQFNDAATRAKALETAAQIVELNKTLNRIHSEQGQQLARVAFLSPWQDSDIALDYSGGREFSLLRGICPASQDSKALREGLAAAVPLAAAELLYSDAEQHYWQIVAHNSAADALADYLKPYSFSRIQFKDEQGTVKECLQDADETYARLQQEEAAAVAQLVVLQGQQPLLEQAFDCLSLEAQREALAASLLATEQTVYLEAWLPEPQQQQVAQALEAQGCAYDFSEAAETEEPPVLMHNSRAAAPFSAITELYGMPAPRSMVDPNPFVAFFFVLFFGMMLGDALYGLILSLATLIALKKMKPVGTLRKFLIVACSVGASAILFGALFSSWFGDFPTALGNMLGQSWAIPPILFDPLSDPISMLFIALGIGVVNLFVGMGLSAYRMIKQGQWFDALCDIGFWYLIVGGLIVVLLGVTPGLYVAAAGALGVLVTGGRKKPKLFGKLTGGLSSLYGITSYLSDILSYSRLMALGLATGVVAQVMNSMGSLAGNGVVGWILFVVVFCIGQTFNLFIGLLGAFVHSCRLIYVEFFGKFFEAGGRAFAPLYYKTKYTRVMKEEN